MGVFLLLMKKKISEIEIMIRGILGKDKFLMLNMTLIKKLDPNSACFLTYLLDKYEFLVKSKQIEDTEGMSVYRRELSDKLNLSPYQQRKIENQLCSLNLISILVTFIEVREIKSKLNILLIILITVDLPSPFSPIKMFNLPLRSRL
jgi:hypothetical protein